MKPTLEGRLSILRESLSVAYTRCRQAAGAAEHVDAELCQQLLAMSAGLQTMQFATDDALDDIEAFRNRIDAPSDYPQGPE